MERTFDSDRDFLTLEEAANFLHISTQALRKICNERRISFVKVHRTSWLFSQEALIDFIQQQTITAIRPKKVDRKVSAGLQSPKQDADNYDRNTPTALRKELQELCQ
jgi:excisionase family DNA binding protein